MKKPKYKVRTRPSLLHLGNPFYYIVKRWYFGWYFPASGEDWYFTLRYAKQRCDILNAKDNG